MTGFEAKMKQVAMIVFEPREQPSTGMRRARVTPRVQEIPRIDGDLEERVFKVLTLAILLAIVFIVTWFGCSIQISISLVCLL